MSGVPKLLPPDLLERFLKSVERDAPISELGLRNHIAALRTELIAVDAKEADATHRAHNAERARDEALRALETIAGLHLGDCPASMDEVDFARAHSSRVRRIARDTITKAPKP